MKEQTYQFIGKTTRFLEVTTEYGTIKEIYDSLIKKGIVDYDIVEDYIVKNYFSNAERECYNALLENYEGEFCEDKIWDLLNDHISELTLDLNDNDMQDIISQSTSNMYYQEWIELED